MNLTINIQTAHRVILGHEEVRPRIDCAHDLIDAEIVDESQDPERRPIHHEGEHHDLCPWPHPTPEQPDPPCVCAIILAAQDSVRRDTRHEIVSLRTDLIRATEAAVAMSQELEPLRHIRLLASEVVAEVARKVPDRTRWSEATRELAEALEVQR